MKSNPLCMKKILEFVDENTGVEIDQDDNILLKSIDLYTVVNFLSQNGEFKPEEAANNALLCEKFEYIDCHFGKDKEGKTFIRGNCPIFNITAKGKNFLDN